MWQPIETVPRYYSDTPKTTGNKSKKPVKKHPWRGSFEHGKMQTNKDLHHTRIATFNRMGIRI